MPITREDVEMYLGDLSDDLVARILTMGMTLADLAEVARQIETSAGRDDTPGDGTVAELCRLVMDDEGAEIWADY